MNNTVVAVVVYNRIENIEHWIHCWNLSDTQDARLVIIHNHYGDEKLKKQFYDCCKKNEIEYVGRKRPGFDIGAFQDVCTGRIDLGEWELLLWCCDDTFPMAKDFLKKFTSKHLPGLVVAMQISPYVRLHLRTTGFMIDKTTAEKLKFPADPVTTKQHCYLFEHRDPKGHFLAQVKAVQVAPNEISPLWDVGYHRRINRSIEHREIFGFFVAPETIEQKEVTTFICPIYKEFPAIISCLIMQTNKNWKLWVIHNGPPEDSFVEAYITLVNDDRISYYETKEHTGNWGHAIRAEYLQKVTSKYVVITNPDNYYVPPFIEKCLNIFTLKGTTIAVYSAQMVHNYTDWKVLQCRLERGFLDCGGVVLKTEHAKAVGWNNITDHSADWFFFEDIVKAYGINRFIPVAGCLYIHN